MKDIDLKTILIGIFVIGFLFFGYQRMDIGRYQIIDNGEELETKDLTNSLLIDFLLEIKCKHTFECSTQ